MINPINTLRIRHPNSVAASSDSRQVNVGGHHRIGLTTVHRQRHACDGHIHVERIATVDVAETLEQANHGQRVARSSQLPNQDQPIG